MSAIAGVVRRARPFEPTVAAYAEGGYRLCSIPQLPLRERLAFVPDAVNADG